MTARIIVTKLVMMLEYATPFIPRLREKPRLLRKVKSRIMVKANFTNKQLTMALFIFLSLIGITINSLRLSRKKLRTQS
jgi:hypothetical protein